MKPLSIQVLSAACGGDLRNDASSASGVAAWNSGHMCVSLSLIHLRPEKQQLSQMDGSAGLNAYRNDSLL